MRSDGPATILIVDDQEDMRWVLARMLEGEGYAVVQACDGKEAIAHFQEQRPDVVLLDVLMNERGGFEALGRMREVDPAVPIVMVTACATVRQAVAAVKLGAYDYIAKPFDRDDLLPTLRRALETTGLRREVEALKASDLQSLTYLMGTSEVIQALIAQVEKVAATPYTVVIQGDTGTGKELVAQTIHRLSSRQTRPFVAIDCAALPETLIESELFGYEKGAFTGANARKEGLFEIADGGTMFLDEVANLSAGTQAKLLRFLEERKVQHLGGRTARPVNVRILAASNADLREAMQAGRFRRDLYHRLTESTIQVPLLRDRKEDILHLARRFLVETNRELGREVRGLSLEAEALLLDYPWPGNVRELRNVIRNATSMATDRIEPRHLKKSLEGTLAPPSREILRAASVEGTMPLREVTQRAVERLEKEIIEEALRAVAGNRVKAAALLQVDYKTLYRKMRRYGLAPRGV